MHQRFLTNLVKPWEKLNELLSRPYAFQPEINDLIRDAENIAIAVRHQAEKSGIPQKEASIECPELTLLVDVADAAKHGPLRDSSRNNTLSISSMVEFTQEPNFRFIRNAITVNHASKGEHDLLAVEAAAISYWQRRLGIPITWSPKIKEGPNKFGPAVTLYFMPQFQVEMKNINLKFFSRKSSGILVLSDPPSFYFEVLEDIKNVT